MKVERPYAYCCAEGGGRVEHCDCVNKNHGTALFDVPDQTQPEASRSPVSEERATAILAEEGIEIMGGSMAYRANVNTGDAIMRAMIRFATDTQPVAGGGECL